MITIKLRENSKDIFTSVYPETTIRDIKMNSYPMQWSRGDNIAFLFMGQELEDNHTAFESGLQEGSCVVVNFFRNMGGAQRSVPTYRNYQNQRAEQAMENSEECMDVLLQCVTPSTLYAFVGLLFLIIMVIRILVPEIFTVASDLVITCLLLFYLFALIKMFVIRG
ncbi:hypothetical protein EIN_094740 [Entamoeba invadens IP1]|uniref:Ubiquitin-like domain-containing protein n=1 Tax=Entamoeba invadens IP1 TaxID=370355 RepID=A0A0A1U033_ENTIV|nr:hypothetical protein EIN_094740 [Entamoeba invadens IP1]ELP87247.1 hypothetical protein EIN_094740 [Entamoeba invadens IP1]|eukprot:XP_004254018.1 hypothetical protein EIN_094740 [Entamoeba invadens IP1]